jgi:hypothetical protein
MTHNFDISLYELSHIPDPRPELQKDPFTISYRIHVSLLDINPLIWRRVELSSQTTLKQLHRILRIMMGGENYPLYGFLVGTMRYRVLDPTYDAPGDVIVEGKIPLAEVLAAAPRFATSLISAMIGNLPLNPQKSVVGRIRRDPSADYGGFRLPAACSNHRWKADVDCPSP